MTRSSKYTGNQLSRLLSRGFTLIELLVVIAIIAILAAILFPVFAQAKVAAKKATCLSNQKNIALAWIMYADDYDGQMVTEWFETTNTVDAGYYWNFGDYFDLNTGDYIVDLKMGLLYPYTKNVDIYRSPIPNPKFASDRPEFDISPIESIMSGCDPITEFECWRAFTVPHSAHFSQVENVAETLLTTDAALISRAGQPLSLATYVQFGPTSRARTHGKFAKQAATSWLDGHAKAMNVDNSSVYAGYRGTRPNPIMESGLKRNNMGDITRAPYPTDPTTYGTPAWAASAYYYLLKKS